LKKVEKTALVIAIVLVLSCVISFAVLYFTDFWVAPLKSTAEVAAAGRDLIALDQQFPFKSPQGAGIPKERLEPFLAASCRTKATADAVQAWIEKNGQVLVAGQTVYSKEGGDLMIAYVKDISAALSDVKMGPEEFDWIHQRLRLAAKGMPSEHKRQEMQESLEEIRKASENPQIGVHERDELKRHIADLETLPDAWGPASQADWALYQANAERIKACGHGHRAVRAVSRLLVHASGGQRISVEFDPDDGPPLPPEPPKLPSAPSGD
jgi:hypothetical protein